VKFRIQNFSPLVFLVLAAPTSTYGIQDTGLDDCFGQVKFPYYSLIEGGSIKLPRNAEQTERSIQIRLLTSKVGTSVGIRKKVQKPSALEAVN
jgi:hypothetical protein